MRNLTLSLAVLCAVASCAALSGVLHAQGGWEKAAWQKTPKLEKKWLDITGRFIFHRTCLPCHTEGADTYTKKEWAEKLEGFPNGDHPELPEEYKDLTAKFAFRRMVPDQSGRLESLRGFLVNAAPKTKGGGFGGTMGLEAVGLLPKVGDKAADFKIKDVKGEQLSLKKLKGKRNIVIVFSRANWCPPCVSQLGELEKEVAALDKLDTTILAIHCECAPSGTERLMKKKNYSFHLANDDRLNIVDRYSVTSTYLIDKKGVIRGRWLDRIHGRVGGAEIRKAVEGLEKK
jgi:peroxiredoxin